MNSYDEAIPGFAIRAAKEEDTGLILDFLRRLAKYERSSHGVSATEAMLHDALFLKKQAEAVIGELDGKPVAFALFFQSFAGFMGRPVLYLEDLYVDEEHRGKGLGRTMLTRLATIAEERGCSRIDWLCLDWNAAAKEFYEGLGAAPMHDMIIYRLMEPKLGELSKRHDA